MLLSIVEATVNNLANNAPRPLPEGGVRKVLAKLYTDELKKK